MHFGALWRVWTAVPSSLACKIESRVKPNLQAPMHNAAPAQAGDHPVGTPCAQQGKGPVAVACGFLRPAHSPLFPHVFPPNIFFLIFLPFSRLCTSTRSLAWLCKARPAKICQCLCGLFGLLFAASPDTMARSRLPRAASHRRAGRGNALRARLTGFRRCRRGVSFRRILFHCHMYQTKFAGGVVM